MMDREIIRQTLRELIEEDTGEKPPDLDDGKSLREELGLDSVDVVSIVSQATREWGSAGRAWSRTASDI